MAVMDRVEVAVQENASGGLEIGNLRRRISEMSSSELLRFGVGTKFRCKRARSLQRSQRKALKAQLLVARTEWNKRHPCLPLRDSF